jgi:DNA polymerase III delta subunit
MGNLDQIEKAVQKLIVLCQKEKPTKTDKEKMLGLHSDILSGIENLTECELCGAISEVIVTMTLSDVTAKLCKECGLKALEAGKIQKTTSRKRTRTVKTRNTDSKQTTSKPDETPQEPESPAALHTRVEEQTGIKKTDVKRLHKIVQDIATPMNLANTLTYVKREVENAKLKVDEGALEKAVEILTAA